MQEVADADADAQTVAIKKYPNRRYYDSTHSRHVTLEQIRDMIRDGHDVAVTDSATGDDISPLVLWQIILDLDTTKLDLLPAELLHQMIRSNESIVRQLLSLCMEQAMRWAAASGSWATMAMPAMVAGSDDALPPLREMLDDFDARLDRLEAQLSAGSAGAR